MKWAVEPLVGGKWQMLCFLAARVCINHMHMRGGLYWRKESNGERCDAMRQQGEVPGGLYLRSLTSPSMPEAAIYLVKPSVVYC